MYRALMLEDDPAAADTLRAHLARFGAEKGARFQVEVLNSALELLEGDHPCDIYFLDIGLPGINGMEAAQIIRQADESTPIVFVTDLAQYAVRGVNGVRYAVPQHISAAAEGKIDIYFRVGSAYRPATLAVKCGDTVVMTRKKQIMTPGEMEKISVDMSKITGDVTLEIEEARPQ